MRPVSPLIVAGLLLGLVVVSAPDARAEVTSGTATTDRTDYVEGMAVTANATFTFSGSPNTIDDYALLTWRWPNGTAAAAAAWVLTTQEGGGTTTFTATWIPPGPALPYSALFQINETSGSVTKVSAVAVFNVHDAADYAIVQGVSVSVPAFVIFNTFVTATVSMLDDPGWVLGSPAAIGSVTFTWLDAALTVLRVATVPAGGGLASDIWLANRSGSGFQVMVAYLGEDPVSNSTSFTVSASTLPAGNVSAGQTVLWNADPRPWRVCGETVVEAGGTLVIEAGVTVLFCPGAVLNVSGGLRIGSSSGAPVRLLPEGGGPPGSWGGITVNAESGTGAVLRNVRVENASDGVVALGASPSIYQAEFVGGTGAGIRLEDSYAAIADVRVEGYAAGLVALRSQPYVLRFAASAVGRGLDMADSPGPDPAQLREISILGAEGLRIQRSPVALANVTVNATGTALDANGATGSGWGLDLAGGATALRVRNTAGFALERARLLGGTGAAVDATNATVRLANATGQSGGTDLVLLASTVTLVNASFDEADRLSLSGTLVGRNFLDVRAENETGAPLPGATVLLESAAESFVRPTGPDGWVRWLEVTDHKVLPNGVSEAYSPRLNVTAVGHYPLDADRLLDMSAPRREVFLFREVPAPPPDVLRASFTAEAHYLDVDFTDTSTPANGTALFYWLWNFGDGTSSTSRTPRHTYLAAGTYEVRLYVSDNAGGLAVASVNVTVTAAVLPYDTDGDGMTNSWEFRYGFDPDNATDANEDPDGDTFTNLEEFTAATDPLDILNFPTTPDDRPPPAPPSPYVPIILAAIAILAVALAGDLIVLPAMRRRRRQAFLATVTLRTGVVYLILGRQSTAAYALFLRAAAGRRGLILSRVPAAALRRRHALGATPIFWLGRIPGGWRTSQTSFLPTNLGGILDGVAKHAAEGKAVALLDGLEYLLTENEFPKVVRFLQKLVETAAQHRAVILIPFDLDTVSSKREALLTRNIEVL